MNAILFLFLPFSQLPNLRSADYRDSVLADALMRWAMRNTYIVPVRVIWAVKGKDVDLPCDITTSVPGDYPKLILWFKDTTGIPLYRYVTWVKETRHVYMYWNW